jgi:hypothetical protein
MKGLLEKGRGVQVRKTTGNSGFIELNRNASAGIFIRFALYIPLLCVIKENR